MSLGWKWLGIQISPFLLLAFWPSGADAQSPEKLQADIEKCENINIPDEAIAACTRLTSEGTFGPARLASVLNNRGSARGNERNYVLALVDFDEALRLNPDSLTAYYNRALARTYMRYHEGAIADFDRALRLNPQFVNAYYNRALVRTRLHDLDGAINDFNEVIRLDPKHTNAHNQSAWILATAPVASVRNGARAVELARTAAELTDWKEAHILQTLAAAYAETGNFPEAVRWQNKALESPEIATKSREESLRQIEFYRRGQPYRTASLP